jgi:hypothetical protein
LDDEKDGELEKMEFREGFKNKFDLDMNTK